MEMNCINCGQDIYDVMCNSCRIKQVALVLDYMGVSSNDLSHAMRDIKKRFSDLPAEDGGLCPFCCEETVSLCPDCYFSSVENFIYFYFTQDTADELFSLVQKN